MKHFEFSQISNIRIERGKELHNWMAILIIGIAMVSFSAFYLWRLYHLLFGDEGYWISPRQILLPLIPLMLGGYCLYTSTRNALVLRVRTATNKSRKLSLKALEKRNEVYRLNQFLLDKLGARVRIRMASTPRVGSVNEIKEYTNAKL